MSTLAHSDSETVSQTNGARSSRVPIPLPNDHYMAVRQAYLATIRDSKSEPFEDYIETEIPQPLPISSSLVPSSDDPYLIVGHAHTPATIDTESEQDEAPSEIKELYLTNTISDRSYTEERALNEREREISEDEGLDSEGKEASPKGQQRQAASVEVTTANWPLEYVPDQQVADETPTHRIPVHTTWIDPEDGTVYLDIEIDPLSRAPVKTPASPKCSSDSLPVSPASLTVPSPVASLVNTPATTIAVDEDEFLEVGAQLKLHESILLDHTQRLDAFPPTLLEGHGRDITELFNRSRAVREEIHS
ncbi:hypothetical protein Tco_0981061 [Tanacetum coccineum]